MPYEQKPEAEEIALWEKQTANGNNYLSGVVKIEGKEYRVVAFKNELEAGSKKPLYSFKKRKEEKAETDEIMEIAFPN